MNLNGKDRFSYELEKFVATRLNPYPIYRYWDDWRMWRDYRDSYFRECRDYKKSLCYCFNAEERLNRIEHLQEKAEHIYKNICINEGGEFIHFPHLTNQKICHEMFENAFWGCSRMFIQMPNLNLEENTFHNYLERDITAERIIEKNVITLSCTLLTTQMLDYDIMMFNAIANTDDTEYSNAAKNHYRPYLFNYVAEIDHNTYKDLQRTQQIYIKTHENISPNEQYVWLECTFYHNAKESLVGLNGYTIHGVGNITKTEMSLHITKAYGQYDKTVKLVSDNYDLNSNCTDDDDFIKELSDKLNDFSLSSIYVYRIGNGNCVYAQNDKKDKGFFFDIGFNHKHRPKLITKKLTYSYTSAMKKIIKKTPSFVILSHWHLDHIAGCYAAPKNFFDKKWFAPDCYDAGLTALRLAKYLDSNNKLFRVSRKDSHGRSYGRMIGKITIGNNTTYKLFMGEKAPCDSSESNCEGIVIKYETPKNKVLMMGDVNYHSFNKATAKCNEPLFSATKIDYLIVPHHGSERTAYDLITHNNQIKIQGKQAIVCCTDIAADNRPNTKHKKELLKRFYVLTTETDGKADDYIEIKL